MEDLKDIRRQLQENPESRELNNRYAQACLDIAKEYTVTSLPRGISIFVRPQIWKPYSTSWPRSLRLRF